MRAALLASMLFACASSPAGMASESSRRPLTTIVYRPDGKLIFLHVSVNGAEPEWFCFDTGAPHSIIDPRLSAKLGLKPLAEGSTTGTGAGSVKLVHLPAVTLVLGDLAIRADDPWEIDLSGVPFSKDARGLIGAELLKRGVVRLDTSGRTLTLFDPATYRPPARATELPLIVEGDKFYVEATLDVRPGLSVTHKLRIDTGSEDSVNDPIVAQAEVTRKSTVGAGLGANFEAVSGTFERVHLGPYTVSEVWGPGAPGPAIGMEILRRFITTFDVSRGKLYLEPTIALNEPVPAPPP